MASRNAKRRGNTARTEAKLAETRAKPVKLRVAASILHQQLGGASRSSMFGPAYIEQLNAAAARLGATVDIYKIEARGALKRLDRAELLGAKFIDGGNVVRTAAGVLHYPLAVRRYEAIAAITSLSEQAKT